MNTSQEPRVKQLILLSMRSFTFICLITLNMAFQATNATELQSDEQKALRTDGNRTPLGFAADSKSAFFLNAINYDAVVEEIEFETGVTKQLRFCKSGNVVDGRHELSLDGTWLIADEASCSQMRLFGLRGQTRKDLFLQSVQNNHCLSYSTELLLNGHIIQRISESGSVDVKTLDRYGHGMFREDESELVFLNRSDDRRTLIISFYKSPTFAKTNELQIPDIDGEAFPVHWEGNSIVFLTVSAKRRRRYIECRYDSKNKSNSTIRLIGTGKGLDADVVDQMRFGKSWYARITANPHLAPEKGKVAASQHQPAFKLEIFDRKTDESLYVMTRAKLCHVIISPDGKRLIEQTSNTEFRFHDLLSKQSVTRIVNRQQ